LSSLITASTWLKQHQHIMQYALCLR